MNRVLEHSRGNEGGNDKQESESIISKNLLNQISDLKLEMGNQSVRIGELRSENILLKQKVDQTNKVKALQEKKLTQQSKDLEEKDGELQKIQFNFKRISEAHQALQ